jgi:ferredoxin
MKKWISIVFLLLNLVLSVNLFANEQRFPKPEFETGYVQPDAITPEPRSLSLEYFDVLILIGVLSLTAFFVYKRRSRKGILWLSIFSLLYFGFFREGCICSIGAIQNMALSFFNNDYAVSWTVIAFFVIPLLFTLFFGRLFCATSCPLGVLQDLLVIKPIRLPNWVQKTLGLFPYIYLGLAVLYAATGTDFIICRFDPYVGIFRMGAAFNMVILGVAFVVLGLFVARPYCRFVCPYGVLLKWMSKLSKNHLSITPSKSIQCNLCEHSCPYDAIEVPSSDKEKLNSERNLKRFIIFAILIPVWIVLGGYTVSLSHQFLAQANKDVYLAEMLLENPELANDQENIDIKTFMASERTIDELVADAQRINEQFYIGSWILGCFIGLVIGVMLMQQFRFRKRIDFEPNRGDCYSCGRCMDYCPVPADGSEIDLNNLDRKKV